MERQRLARMKFWRHWRPSSTATLTIWGRFITTFTQWKRHRIRSELWLGRTNSPRSRLPRDISSICRRMFTFAPVITKRRLKPNEQAAEIDRAYLKATGVQGIYPMMYYSHNLHFIAMCSAMNGNYTESKKNAELLVGNVGPHVKDMPPLEGSMTIP